MIQGLKYFMMASGAQKGIIGIEDNKPDAIALVKEKVASEPNIEVCVCAEKYPEGSEKHLIYAATGRTVPDRWTACRCRRHRRQMSGLRLPATVW